MALLDDIHAMHLRRAAVNHATYKTLYEKASDRIRRVAAMSRGHTAVHFRVPPFVWGRPPYKHAHAVRYVSEKLRRNGFHVADLGEGLLEVRWARARAAPPGPAGAPGSADPPAGHRAARRPPARARSSLSARLVALRRHFD